MFHRPTLRWYRELKLYIGYDRCYNISKNSEYLAKARINSLQLEEYLGRGKEGYIKKCKLCMQGEEDLEHFLVVCPMIQVKRDGEIMKKWQNLDDTKKTASILFKDREFERTGYMIKIMWLHRKELLKPP